MTQIVDHGKWVPYQPDTPQHHAPPTALFARRESDGVDWYVYSRARENFSPDTVKFTVRWQDVYNGFIIDAATYDVTRLFPAGGLLREIIDYHGGDPQTELGQKLFDPDTRTLHSLPVLPPAFDFEGLEARVAALEAQIGARK